MLVPIREIDALCSIEASGLANDIRISRYEEESKLSVIFIQITKQPDVFLRRTISMVDGEITGITYCPPEWMPTDSRLIPPVPLGELLEQMQKPLRK